LKRVNQKPLSRWVWEHGKLCAMSSFPKPCGGCCHLGNEFITLLKDTSLVAVIGFEELFREGQLIVVNNRSFEIYAVALFT